MVYLHGMKNPKTLLYALSLLLFYSCAAQKRASRSSPLEEMVNDTLFRSAHLGISVYDVNAKRYLMSHQAEKYFTPASNTKIVTCYLAMKYLKHILPGLRYYENDTAVYLLPTGDPSLLHRDFPRQPVIDFLKQQKKKVYITDLNWKDKELGRGWSWEDYSYDYMVERSALPVYGNTIRWVQQKLVTMPGSIGESVSVYSDPEVNWKVRFELDSLKDEFTVDRERSVNEFIITQGPEAFAEVEVPFIVNGIASALQLLKDTTGISIGRADHFVVTDPNQKVVWSQPLDSILRPMMYRSDNFFAEQMLLMVSAERLGVMSDPLVIDTILRTDLAGLPQKPSWADGSGLSRYNLFTPMDMVSILDSMRNEFGMSRIKGIFPTGDSGTLKGYYHNGNAYIYAKTGTLSGVLALSGFLYTKQNKLLIFSVMVNNYIGSNVAARRRIERFLESLR